MLRKPSWYDKKIHVADDHAIKSMLAQRRLHTVCQEARCPNISECFSHNTLTFLILGKHCTRHCRFCNIESNAPSVPDTQEPQAILETVRELGLSYVVITSVTRDDLPDGGAEAFAETIRTLRDGTPHVKIEVLIPDFQGDPHAIKKVIAARPDVIGHNMETVRRLYAEVRPEADYERSLGVLSYIKETSASTFTKSSLMLGLGETHDEACEVLRDLRAHHCDFVSIGQYLAPSCRHYPVQKYYTQEEFDLLAATARAYGFTHALSGPYVRSSFHAAEFLSSSLKEAL
jgi:lipoic acid synthetase